MSEFQRQILLVSLGVLATAGFLVWSVTTIRYQITSRKLRITWLGLPVRWVRLENIKHIGTRPAGWMERWPNVLFDSGRTLVIRRKRGLLFRSLLITPKYPFEFKATLEQARNTVCKVTLPASPASGPRPVPDPGPTDTRSAA